MSLGQGLRRGPRIRALSNACLAPQLLCLIWERAGVCRVTTVRFAALFLLDAVLFVLAFGEPADEDVGGPDETSVAIAAASRVHSFPVASMPPFAPPEQSWAWTEKVKSVPATIEIRNFAFMPALRSSWPGSFAGPRHATRAPRFNIAPASTTRRGRYSGSDGSNICGGRSTTCQEHSDSVRKVSADGAFRHLANMSLHADNFDVKRHHPRLARLQHAQPRLPPLSVR